MAECVPPQEETVQTDVVRDEVVAALAATLGLAEAPCEHLPPLWHWLLFLDLASASSLGADGHRAVGGLVSPPAGLPRRMWAGGRLRFHHPLFIGQSLRCATAVIARRDREGRAGRLHLVTLGLRVMGDTLLMEEERDLVYRALPALPAKRGIAPTAADTAPAWVMRRRMTPDAVMLFRFSALTFNSHRIHYDRDFCRDVEFYPDLVVHGPLQAVLLAGLLHDIVPPQRMRRFSYRAVAPAFVGDVLTLEAWRDPAGAGIWHMRSLGPDHVVRMTAEAELEPTGTGA